MRFIALTAILLAFHSTAFSSEPPRIFGREIRRLAVPAADAHRYTAASWRRVKTYEMQELKRVQPLPLRQIVAVRFNYRQARIQHWKPNWYRGSIWRYRREARDEFDYIHAVVSKADLESFRAIASDFRAGREYLVYGQVLKDVDENFTFLRLIGTKVKRDARENVTVVW